MSKSPTNLNAARKFQVVRTMFNPKVTRQLIQVLISVDWLGNLQNICKQLSEITQAELDGKFAWMLGTDPTYFIQYQIDSYAIIKGYNKVILVWKPKYIEYPTIVKISNFTQQTKTIKSIQVTTEQKIGSISDDLVNKIDDFIKKYYGSNFFANKEVKFETDLVTQLKHYVSRESKQSYWHCAIDNHNSIAVSGKNSFYLKVRIRGVKQKYDKDLVIFSQQGKKQFMIKGKGVQIISFLTMLVIFISVISCPSESEEGICSYKNEMILGSAAIMMGIMGMRFMSKGKDKKRLEKRIKDLEKQE